MSVYQDAIGQWIFFDGKNKHVFVTEGGAAEMSRKNDFGEEAQTRSTTLAQVISMLDSLVGVYFDRGYNSGGAEEIADSDLESLGITAADLVATITLAQQLQNFANGDAVAPADYSATLNKMRTDI